MTERTSVASRVRPPPEISEPPERPRILARERKVRQGQRVFRYTLCGILIFLVILFKVFIDLSAKPGNNWQTRPRAPFVWDKEILNHNGSMGNGTGATCRNSVQGRLFITDDRGYVCPRLNMDHSAPGCCLDMSNSTGGQFGRYSCYECREDNHCCTTYEFCVSCCLDPKQKPILENLMNKAGRSSVLPHVDNAFDLCLAACRTNSHSLLHENRFRSEQKHCYGVEEPIADT